MGEGNEWRTSDRLGSLLDASERCVEFEHVREVFGALISEAVPADTEKNGDLTSGGFDVGGF